MNKALVALGVAAGLSACSGGGGGGGGSEQSNSFCHTIPALSVDCANCVQVSDTGAVFDGNFQTAAQMGAGGSGTFQGTSFEQPAGSFAGIYFILPNPAGVTITLSTYLNGVQQEVAAPVTRQTPNDNCSGIMMRCSFTDGGGSYVGMGTTKPYDSIHADVQNTSADVLQLAELCVD